MVSIEQFVRAFYRNRPEITEAVDGLAKSLAAKKVHFDVPEPELLGALLFVATQYKVKVEQPVPKKTIAHMIGVDAGKFKKTCESVRSRLGIDSLPDQPPKRQEPPVKPVAEQAPYVPARKTVDVKVEIRKPAPPPKQIKIDVKIGKPSRKKAGLDKACDTLAPAAAKNAQKEKPPAETKQRSYDISEASANIFPYSELLSKGYPDETLNRARKLFSVEPVNDDFRGRPRNPTLKVALSVAYSFVESGDFERAVESGMLIAGSNYSAFLRALLRYDDEMSRFLIKEAAAELKLGEKEEDALRIYERARKGTRLADRRHLRYAAVIYGLDEKAAREACERSGQNYAALQPFRKILAGA